MHFCERFSLFNLYVIEGKEPTVSTTDEGAIQLYYQIKMTKKNRTINRFGLKFESDKGNAFFFYFEFYESFFPLLEN